MTRCGAIELEHRGVRAVQHLIEHAPGSGALALWAAHHDLAEGQTRPEDAGSGTLGDQPPHGAAVTTDGHTLFYTPGFAELALRETDPAQLRRSLEQLAISSGRAAHLISQLLALARTENQRVAGGLQPIDLAPLLREVVTGWADAALARGIDFGLEDDEQSSPIAGHPILLRELFGNLIDNALRYTPVGGRVTVRRRIDGTSTVVEVEDSGPGIALAERALVFERFYRVLGSGTEGSGLGLAIVREIAQQHGAQVSVGGAEPIAPGKGALAPRIGVGAVFTVRFPPGSSPQSL